MFWLRVALQAFISAIVVGVLIVAAALAGGLTDDRAFTPAAKEASH